MPFEFSSSASKHGIPREDAYYDTWDEDIAAGRVAPVRTTYRTAPGTRVSDTELDAILRGRPNLGQARATGTGRSPSRHVRLSPATDAALTEYVRTHGTTTSAVIREALEKFLNDDNGNLAA